MTLIAGFQEGIHYIDRRDSSMSRYSCTNCKRVYKNTTLRGTCNWSVGSAETVSVSSVWQVYDTERDSCYSPKYDSSNETWNDSNCETFS